MYSIFFQPFQAVEVLKKGSNRAFAGMLLLGSALLALGVLLFMNTPGMSWVRSMGSELSWDALSYVQYFFMLLVSILALNFVRAFLVHLVMKIFTDKGAYIDAVKVMAVNTFLMAIYILLAVIAGAIPLLGMGLAALVFAVGCLITLSVTLKGLATLYKSDIITTWVAFSVLVITMVMSLHMAFAGAVGMGYKGGMMKQGRVFKYKSPMMQWNTSVQPGTLQQ